ncbi:MAG TPA: sigma-70 family RNA polymerase sigma factor [Gaiellaceae bacterium]|nr:sigma-70 family RNA polymerase sigma factor [Gaiellaceae bacterium]
MDSRKEPEKMGLSLAYSAAVPSGAAAESHSEDFVDAPTDADLIQRVAVGDANAFEVLYHRYVRSVFGLALRRLGDRMRAEDAVQETFAAVWRSARTFRPDRGPGAPWLYAVARNAIVDRARGRHEPPGEAPETASAEPGPDERAEAAYVSWRIHRALSGLPPNERDVLELAYYGGLSQSEVADFLGIPLGTVKTRTRAALHRLADVLEGELR